MSHPEQTSSTPASYRLLIMAEHVLSLGGIVQAELSTSNVELCERFGEERLAVKADVTPPAKWRSFLFAICRVNNAWLTVEYDGMTSSIFTSRDWALRSDVAAGPFAEDILETFVRHYGEPLAPRKQSGLILAGR